VGDGADFSTRGIGRFLTSVGRADSRKRLRPANAAAARHMLGSTFVTTGTNRLRIDERGRWREFAMWQQSTLSHWA
jgi:hypothetical protein